VMTEISISKRRHAEVLLGRAGLRIHERMEGRAVAEFLRHGSRPEFELRLRRLQPAAVAHGQLRHGSELQLGL